ncbi:hypothetical protein [Nocardioides sp. W7]|uniref:hypothetical protein n=1 Tax=Nocardioides sp. W7 TaxID=2931390 RepID=UPI001FCFABA7|nr:hypothetical protein [Nocardioides sp. W7]
MTGTTWVGDPAVAWTPAVSVRRPPGLDTATLREAVDELTALLPGGAGSAPVVEEDRDGLLLGAVTGRSPHPVQVGLSRTRLAISVDHSVGDGLSLLALLTALTGRAATSGAAGVGDRPPRHGFVEARLRRVGEALLSPPSEVAPTRSTPGPGGDVFASTVVDARLGTAALVAACAAAAPGLVVPSRLRRTRVAVGVSRPGGAEPTLGDQSALLRLGPGQVGSVEAARTALRSLGTEPAAADPVYADRAWLATLTARVQAGLAGRLGSTYLVSHLGELNTDLDDVAFYPVTGGGSGVSIGAAVQDGRTLLTARGRGARHDPAGLSRILDAVADRAR